MDADEIVTYAKGILAALRVIGPTPRDRVLGMLRALELSDDDAEKVLHEALARGLLAADPISGKVHTPPAQRRSAPTAIVTPRSPRRRRVPAPRAGSYVLVVEDDDVLRGAIRASLEEEGLVVEAAANGAQAISVLIARGRPSVVVAGLVNSLSDGGALIERMRAVPACAALPLIAASVVPVQHPPAGMTFLPQPLTATSLMREVQRFCASHRAPAPAT